MRLLQLQLSQFRAHTASVLEAAPGVNLLIGANGAGKTNVLEALGYLCLGKSFLGASDSHVLQRGEPHPRQVEIHEDFISSCFDRLRAAYDTVSVIERDGRDGSKLQQELTRLCRVLGVLHEYVLQCDSSFAEERVLVPLYRASRGRQLCFVFLFIIWSCAVLLCTVVLIIVCRMT